VTRWHALAGLALFAIALAVNQVARKLDRATSAANYARAETAIVRSQMTALVVAHNALASSRTGHDRHVAEQLEVCRVRTANLRTVAETLILSSTSFPERKQLPNTPDWPPWPVKESGGLIP
jgi:hypothetical protein